MADPQIEVVSDEEFEKYRKVGRPINLVSDEEFEKYRERITSGNPIEQIQAMQEVSGANPITQGLENIAEGVVDFVAPSPRDFIEGGGTIQGAKAGAKLGSRFGVPGALVGGGVGGVLGNLLGGAGGQVIEDAIDPSKLVEVPPLDIGESIVKTPLILGANKLLGGGEKRGQQFINKATKRKALAISSSYADFKRKVYDEIADDLKPEINKSFEHASKLGVFKSFAPEAVETATYKEIQRLEPIVRNELKEAQRVISPEDIRKTMTEKAFKSLSELDRKYKDVDLKQVLFDEFRSFWDTLGGVESLTDLHDLKLGYYVNKINFNKELAVSDKVKNDVNRTIGRIIKEGVEDLYAVAVDRGIKNKGKDYIKKINENLGSLYDVDKVVRKTTAKNYVKPGLSFGEAASMAGSSAALMYGIQSGNYGPSLAAGVPLGYFAAQQISRSPSGSKMIAGAEEALGRGLLNIVKFPREAEKLLGLKEPIVQELFRITGDAALAQTANSILEEGSLGSVSNFFNNLITTNPAIAENFDPSPIRGIKSYFDGKILDPLERQSYAEEIKAKEKDVIQRAKKLEALNRDGTVLGVEQRVILPEVGEVIIPVEKEEKKVYTSSLTGKVVENAKRQEYNY